MLLILMNQTSTPYTIGGKSLKKFYKRSKWLLGGSLSALMGKPCLTRDKTAPGFAELFLTSKPLICLSFSYNTQAHPWFLTKNLKTNSTNNPGRLSNSTLEFDLLFYSLVKLSHYLFPPDSLNFQAQSLPPILLTFK